MNDERDRPIRPAETPATPEGDQADWSDPRVRQPGEPRADPGPEPNPEPMEGLVDEADEEQDA